MKEKTVALRKIEYVMAFSLLGSDDRFNQFLNLNSEHDTTTIEAFRFHLHPQKLAFLSKRHLTHLVAVFVRSRRQNLTI